MPSRTECECQIENVRTEVINKVSDISALNYSLGSLQGLKRLRASAEESYHELLWIISVETMHSCIRSLLCP